MKYLPTKPNPESTRGPARSADRADRGAGGKAESSPRDQSAKPKGVGMKIAPKTFDLVAQYEPRADFALTPNVRRALDALARKYRRITLMTGKHSGKPVLHTDIKGISVGTRIEVSRLTFRPSTQADVLADVFRLFVEANERGVASGPIRRILLNFHKAEYNPLPRAAAREAFRQVFGAECCFLTEKRTHLELGRCVVHQTLLEHLREDGPYHSDHQRRIEEVQTELQKNPGRYEAHTFFAQPLIRENARPELQIVYSGDAADNLVEIAMRQKTAEQLVFVPDDKLQANHDDYDTLDDYERASRRFGTLWVMQDDLIRPLDRQRASALYLFMTDDLQPLVGRWLSWQDLFERLRECKQVNRASRNSTTFLDMSVYDLTKSGFLEYEKGQWRLSPAFEQFKHVTFYELGAFGKRLA